MLNAHSFLTSPIEKVVVLFIVYSSDFCYFNLFESYFQGINNIGNKTFRK